MLSGIQLNVKLPRCLSCIGLVLCSLCLRNGEAWAQIPPVNPGPNISTSITVQFASSSYTVNENAGAAMLTVTLNTSSSSVVTVNYATSDGTAVAGTDYTATSGTLTFNPGVTSQNINVGIIDNHNYSGQSVYFTVTLSNPSANANLASPAAANVNILDNDPPPTVTININGVPAAQKNNPGGFVCVNANNDNGSKLNYSNGQELKAPDTYGIPQSRDFSVSPLNTADPDLLQLTLQTQNTNGTESVTVTFSSSGRAKIQMWYDTKKKNQIFSNAQWGVAGMPPSVYAEGLLEGAALREVTVTLTIYDNKGNQLSTDSCTLTVTPVLTNLVVTAAKDATPEMGFAQGLGYLFDSGGGLPAQAFSYTMSAQWNAVKGNLKYIQNITNAQILAGKKGANLNNLPVNTTYIWDFPTTGQTLVDCSQTDLPFYTLHMKSSVTNNVATVTVDDNPILLLNVTNNVLPAVGNTTTIGVTFNYVTFAVIAFNDKSIYCLGQQSWNVCFAGNITQPQANNYNFAPGGNNASNGSGAFAASVRNNANPSNIGPTRAGTGGDTGASWH